MIAVPMRVPLAFSFLLAGIASAGGETRRLQFEIEPIIILKCVEQVDYTLDTATLLSAGDSIPIFGGRARTTGGSARKIEANFGATSVLNDAEGTVVDIIVEDACSVRGLGQGEGFLVDVQAVSEGRLTNANAGGVLKVKGAEGKPSYASRFARRFSIPQNRIRLDTPIRMDVRVSVDLQYASGSGRYASPVDGVFSIEVSAP